MSVLNLGSTEQSNICVSDIRLFTQSSIGRGNNDKNNKKREMILEHTDTPLLKNFENDPEYGDEWCGFNMKTIKALNEICPHSGAIYKRIIQKAGRGHNYDLLVEYYNDPTMEKEFQIYCAKIEFKCSKSSQKISKLPQFLSLNISFSMFPMGYHEYYYDEFIQKYVEIHRENMMEETSLLPEIPTKSDYLKWVCQNNYDKHPFFQYYKNHEDIAKKKKSDLVNGSICQYLKIYGHMINLNVLTEKFRETQEGKIYLLWDLKQYFTEVMDISEFDELTFMDIYKQNKIRIQSNKYIFHMLLRWKNHKGILLPAWQISLEEKS
jgi:hypothetical protein